MIRILFDRFLLPNSNTKKYEEHYLVTGIHSSDPKLGRPAFTHGLQTYSTLGMEGIVDGCEACHLSGKKSNSFGNLKR